jgi:hypothetical protein
MLAFAIFVIVNSIHERHNPRSAHSERALISGCRTEVAAYLKAPSGARWPGDEAVGTDANGTWHVTGGVDAQNLMGVLLPYRWRCSASWRGDHWEILTASVD